jgi:hypothetical protein
VDHAVEFFVAALDDSVLVTPYLLGLLIDHCLGSLNWKAALRLVQGMTLYPMDVAKLLVKSPDNQGLATRLNRLFDLCGIPHGRPPPQLNIDPWGLRHIRVAIWTKHLFEAAGRSLWVDYYGRQPPPDSGFRAVDDVEWSSAAIRGLQAYGITQQLNVVEEHLSRFHQDFLSLAPRTTPVRASKELRQFRLRLVTQKVQNTERRTRDLVSEFRDARINAIAGFVDNSERDLVPLQQRLYSVGGIAVLRRIQEAELYHVQLETEFYRIHRTARLMRLRLRQLETIQLTSEVMPMVEAWRDLRAKARHRYGDCGRKTRQQQRGWEEKRGQPEEPEKPLDEPQVEDGIFLDDLDLL